MFLFSILSSWFSWVTRSQSLIYDVYVDWDGTIARTDTLSVLAQIGYDHHDRHQIEPPLPLWGSFSTAWMDDYTAHENSYQPSKTSRKTAGQEIEWLRSLKDVEGKSIARVEAAGVFEGLDCQLIDAAAKLAVHGSATEIQQPLNSDPPQKPKITLRGGFFQFAKSIYEKQGNIRIISVNWSAFFIYSCLIHAASKEVGIELMQSIEIVANEINALKGASENVISTSIERRKRIWRDFHHANKGLWTSEHKANILKAFRDLDNVSGKTSRPFIYIGDSPTDLECLLLADVGIVVKDDPYEGSQPEMMETLSRINVEVKWIGDFNSGDASSKNKVLWWAKDFTEIQESKIFSR